MFDARSWSIQEDRKITDGKIRDAFLGSQELIYLLSVLI